MFLSNNIIPRERHLKWKPWNNFIIDLRYSVLRTNRFSRSFNWNKHLTLLLTLKIILHIITGKAFFVFADKIEISRTLETKNGGKREREHKCWKSIKTAELQFVVVRVVLSIQDNSLKCLNEKGNEILPFDVLILLQKCAFSS